MLPQFPLHLVVYPNENLNLHIFEERYRQLVRDAEEDGLTFGIPAFIDGKVMDVGTELELTKVEKRYPSGESDIRTKGKGRYRIIEFYPVAKGKLYAGARIEKLSLDLEGEPLIYEQLLERLGELFQLLHLDKPLPKLSLDFSTFDLAHQCGLSVQQEYRLLTVDSEVERQAFLLQHLDQLIPTMRNMRRLRERIQLNGHFQDLTPPKF